MTSWKNIYSIINASAKLHDNVVDLEDLNDGYIIDNYDANKYEFYSHNYIVCVDKNMDDSKLIEIFEAYLDDADAFDEVVRKYNLLPSDDDYSTVSVFEFVSTVTLISRKDKFNFDSMTYMFDFSDIEWKDLENELSFNKATDKIDYAFATINTNNIYDDSNCVTIQWTVYAQPNVNTATVEDARRFIINNILDKFDDHQFLLFDKHNDEYYLNFGLTFFELK